MLSPRWCFLIIDESRSCPPRPRLALAFSERYPCGSMSLHPPGFIEPCLPTGSRTAPTGPQWAYEIKHDGFRFICHSDGERVRVFSRSGRECGAQLPAITAALRALPVRSAIIDGEVVICGPTAAITQSAFGRFPTVQLKSQSLFRGNIEPA